MSFLQDQLVTECLAPGNKPNINQGVGKFPFSWHTYRELFVAHVQKWCVLNWTRAFIAEQMNRIMCYCRVSSHKWCNMHFCTVWYFYSNNRNSFSVSFENLVKCRKLESIEGN